MLCRQQRRGIFGTPWSQMNVHALILSTVWALRGRGQRRKDTFSQTLIWLTYQMGV
ncbi:hypothetical protein GCM10022286_01780 [Gryllotalpicola daejeonensis]|uniref:Uncharacterized protein n=1 Tax=Gryllotalpicola daejeonensis TaxID=993087 RepID=A0ABP7ZDL6_9MICO